ncbi:hypothetical protein TIFTF001_049636 [Ficus carica]|uniref:Uncharacterized protein n=1 Tax=Ficus carica TaxID=3494 RepID=A0AA87Z5U9_FICCA|nr:hypothetical protein TIFTF001_049636 [Ficus carica]
MPPVEEIDEFDDDVSHLVRPDIEWTLPTSSSKPPLTPSLPPPSPTLPPPIHWCWSVYSSSKKIKAPPVWGRRPSGAPASGAPGALVGRQGRARRRNPMDPTVEGKRRATIMKRVHMARKRGERIQVTFDEKGQPEGKHGDELMSWIGVLAREHVPIWIQDWRSRDLDGLKEIIWKETLLLSPWKKASGTLV